MAFKARLKAPSADSKFWKHTSAGGVNSCLLIANGSCIPNCVGYSWGRWYEILGKKPALSRRNAELWFGYVADGYKRGRKPKLGAVACWRKGEVGVSSDGAGHVAIVEKINADGSIVISESGYKTFRFRTRTIKPPYSLGGSYVFQGFIYLPEEERKNAGTYVTLQPINFRTQPSLNATRIAVIGSGVRLTGTVDDNGWLETMYKGKVGYVRQKGQKVYCEEV